MNLEKAGRIDYENLSLPSKFTPSLTGDENFPSAADWLLPVLDQCLGGRGHKGEPFGYYNYQKWAFRHALEIYPEGHPKAGLLRFRQVLILMARQNGKTEMGAGFGIFGLMREPGDRVTGVASKKDQAQLLYSRTADGIARTPALSKRFKKVTRTRGIENNNGAIYNIVAAKSDTIQGDPIELGLFDEVHIVKDEVHQALLAGLGGRDDAILIMISTAGDENSTLLNRLQELGDEAIMLPPEKNRFGYFVWEADEAKKPDDPEELRRQLLKANPKYSEGHADINNLIEDIKSMHDIDVIRYHLNRKVESSDVFVPLPEWLELKRPQGEPFPKTNAPVFAIERTRDWMRATVTVNTEHEGKIYSEIVAVIQRPTEEKLLKLCLELKRLHKPKAFVMDYLRFRNLAKWLKDKNITCYAYSSAELAGACSTFYALIRTKKLVHGGDPILTEQMPMAVANSKEQTFTIGRAKPSCEIDAIYSTALGTYGAQTIKTKTPTIH